MEEKERKELEWWKFPFLDSEKEVKGFGGINLP